MLNIEQIDKSDFLKYVKYMDSTVKTIPIEEKPYYRELYMQIKRMRKIKDMRIRSRL
jgi:hypothetical protein